MVNTEFSHVIPLACCLHVFNLIAKKVVAHVDMKGTVEIDRALVNFFSSSSFWSFKLSKWRKKEGVTHGLRTFCESRWYSMAKVAMSVESHEKGFQNCLAMLRDNSVPTPSINKNIIVAIENRDHFTSNSILVKLLRPIVNAIGQLEKANTSVGDIWKEIGTVYQQLLAIDLSSYPRFEPFKAHCLQVLHEHAKLFNEPIYIIGFFLNPMFRQVAVSKAFTIDDMIKMIISLAKAWNYKKADALSLREQVLHYFSGVGVFRVSTKSKCT
jgi:hypothetical protein